MQRDLRKINDYINSNMDRPFKWGDFDCCLFACDIVSLAGGVDFASEVRGTYDSEVGAKKVLINNFGTMKEAFSSLPEINHSFAKRGDIVMFKTEIGDTLSLLWAGSFWAVTPAGLRPLSDKEITNPVTAWSVG